jgi:hypothetical protein
MQNYFPSFRAGRPFAFRYHPLLQGVPEPNTQGAFLMFGHRVDWAHDAGGLRRTKPLDPAKPHVAVIGGSTTYDTGNSNATMWTHRLEELDGQAEYLNLGMPGFSTVEHVIQTAFYLPERKDVSCAIYYVGWNDARNSHQPDLDPGYSNFHLLIQPGMLALRNSFEPGSPILTLLGNKFGNWSNHVPEPPSYPRTAAKKGLDERLIKLYARNLSTIAALNQKRGLRSAFIAQVLNYSVMTSEVPARWMPTLAPRDFEPVMLAFNRALQETAARNGIPVVVPEPSLFAPADFRDDGHFSPAGAAKFARRIHPEVRQACFPPQ